MSNGTSPGKRRGCLFYGAITLIVLLVIGGVGGMLAFRYARSWSARMVEQYTESTPTVIERIRLPREQQEALERRIAVFQNALEQQTNATELTLTAEELNGLIALHPELRDHVFVSIDNSRVKGQISLPLSDLGPFKLNGRYLNGEATFNVQLAEGRLSVMVEDLRVKGEVVPEALVGVLKNKNLAEEILQDPDAAKAISQFESIQIRDGTVVLRNKIKP